MYCVAYFDQLTMCWARHSLVQINFLRQKQLFLSLTEQNKEKEKMTKRLKKHRKVWKRLFQPANRVQSTQSLVKIHNSIASWNTLNIKVGCSAQSQVDKKHLNNCRFHTPKANTILASTFLFIHMFFVSQCRTVHQNFMKSTPRVHFIKVKPQHLNAKSWHLNAK